jgi:hypothetical protein
MSDNYLLWLAGACFAVALYFGGPWIVLLWAMVLVFR